MTEAGLKEDKTTNRAAWNNKIISYTGDPGLRHKPGIKKKIVYAGDECINVSVAEYDVLVSLYARN